METVETGHELSCYGHSVTLIDIDDWRDSRSKRMHFVRHNMSAKLPLDSDFFDFVCTYNFFEHVDNPAIAFSELSEFVKRPAIYIWILAICTRVLGDYMRIERFTCPIHNSYFQNPLLKLNCKSWEYAISAKKSTTLQPLNQWRICQFARLWNESNCDVISFSLSTDFSCLKMIEEFPQAFRGRGLSFEDVTTSNIYVSLRKR